MSLFFLTKIQEKVFKSLSEEPMSVTDIAGLAHLPRTTVSKALLHLEKIELVQGRKVREKNRHVYSRVSDDLVHKKLADFGTTVVKDKQKTQSISVKKIGPVSFFVGGTEIFSALMDMVTLSKNERIYVIQGKNAPAEWTKLIGEKSILGLHDKIIKNELIVVSLRSQTMKQEVEKSDLIKESYKGRLAVPRILSDDFFEDGTTVYLYRNRSLFVNIEEKFAVLVEDKKIMNAMMKLFNAVFKVSSRE